jgi:hypothetical protein
MNTTVALLAVLGIFVVLALPALLGLRHEARIDRQLRAARAGQNSSSNPTEPSTATWYAEGRRSKKLVSS